MNDVWVQFNPLFIIGFSLGVGDIKAIFDQDTQHVVILWAPLKFVIWSKKGNSIKEILDSIVSGLTTKVLECYYGDKESKIPAIDYLGVKPAPVPSLAGAHVLWTVNEVKLTSQSHSPLPSTNCRFSLDLSWIGGMQSFNWSLLYNAYLISSILFIVFLSLVLARRLLSTCLVISPTNFPYVVLHAPLDNNQIFLRLTPALMFPSASPISHYSRSTSRMQYLSAFQFKYEPLHSYVLIHKVVEGWNKCIREFYWWLWFADDKEQDVEEFLRLYLDTLNGEMPVLFTPTSGRRSASAELK